MTTQQLILNKVEESFKKAEAFFGKTLERPRNIIFKRSGTTAGWSCYGRKELMFQLDLAEHHQEDFINETVPHEVAHYVDDLVYGNKYANGRRQVHGPRWKYIMTRVYGLNPDRCHNYDTSVTITRKQDRYEYTCGCTTHKISTTLHNKILRGNPRSCMRCRQRITWKNGNVIPKSNPLSIKDQEIQRLKEQIAKLTQS
jgi:SprT protein